LTGGEASDSCNFEILLDLGPDIAPRAAITDKGYDAKANRDGARKRGICPVIPYKSNAIDRPAFFPKILYQAASAGLSFKGFGLPAPAHERAALTQRGGYP
jgi:hypothetical protein